MSTSTPFLLNERHRKFVQGEARRPASGLVYRILGVCLFTVALLPLGQLHLTVVTNALAEWSRDMPPHTIRISSDNPMPIALILSVVVGWPLMLLLNVSSLVWLRRYIRLHTKGRLVHGVITESRIIEGDELDSHFLRYRFISPTSNTEILGKYDDYYVSSQKYLPPPGTPVAVLHHDDKLYRLL